jgi:hypothetical protein
MKYKISREWHDNTGRKGLVIALGTMCWEGFCISLAEFEPDMSRDEIENRLDEWRVMQVDGEMSVDFGDYTYRLIPIKD